MGRLFFAWCALMLVFSCGPKRTVSPAVTITPCDAVNQCTEPGKSCQNVQGTQMCVYTCPGSGGTAGAVCGPDQFAASAPDGTSCHCVSRVADGRPCSSDADCGHAPDESGGATYLCATMSAGRVCEPLGTACASQSDCDQNHRCDVPTRTCAPQPLNSSCVLDPPPSPTCQLGVWNGSACVLRPGDCATPTPTPTPVPDNPTPVTPTCTPTSVDQPVPDDRYSVPWGWCGVSYNLIFGTRNCGAGSRLGADATKVDGGNAHCEVIGWANDVCNADPNMKWGNSTVTDACKVYSQVGATASGDGSDCRYIVHFGTAGCDGLACQMAHTVRVTSGCQ